VITYFHWSCALSSLPDAEYVCSLVKLSCVIFVVVGIIASDMNSLLEKFEGTFIIMFYIILTGAVIVFRHCNDLSSRLTSSIALNRRLQIELSAVVWFKVSITASVKSRSQLVH